MEPLDKLAEIERLAKLPPIEFSAVREEAAQRLGLTPEQLDEEVAKVRQRLIPLEEIAAELAKLSPLAYD